MIPIAVVRQLASKIMEEVSLNLAPYMKFRRQVGFQSLEMRFFPDVRVLTPRIHKKRFLEVLVLIS